MSTDEQAPDKVVYVRLPADLHAELSAWAVEDRRSLNSLARVILERAVRQYRAQKAKANKDEYTEGNRNADLMVAA
jgi:hypothetical protein